MPPPRSHEIENTFVSAKWLEFSSKRWPRPFALVTADIALNGYIYNNKKHSDGKSQQITRFWREKKLEHSACRRLTGDALSLLSAAYPLTVDPYRKGGPATEAPTTKPQSVCTAQPFV